MRPGHKYINDSQGAQNQLYMYMKRYIKSIIDYILQ